MIRGQCLCGAVAYEYDGVLGPAGYCHCEDCRRCTGSAFNVSVRCDLASFRIIRGQPRGYTRRGASGNDLTRHFCADCGSPLFTSSPSHPEHIYVKAGSLDDPTLVQPATQSWLESAVAWRHIEPDIPSFERGS